MLPKTIPLRCNTPILHKLWSPCSTNLFILVFRVDLGFVGDVIWSLFMVGREKKGGKANKVRSSGEEKVENRKSRAS